MSPAKRVKPTEKVLQLVILYRVPVGDFNPEEVLDRLRETGSAVITEVTLEDGPV